MIEFQEFGKIARLSRECTITEKIDGTNAQIMISDDLSPFVLGSGREVPFMVGSRTRWIFPENDNYGFARWAYSHVNELLALGPGSHYGEWWGAGIQRKYGKSEKVFSLFNTHRWGDPATRPACCDVVPVLYEGKFTTGAVDACLARLEIEGSVAAPGFDKPEGVVVYHQAARCYFKKTVEKDEEPKGKQPCPGS
jgi:hypothetical protein